MAYRGALEVFHRSRATDPLEVVHRREEHVAVVVADHAFQDVELPASAVAAHPATVAPVLGGAYDLQHVRKNTVT